MNKVFYQKIGMAIEFIANELYLLQKGSRMPSISDFQEDYSLSRGTVQNALDFLKKEKAIETKSKGHLGTFIESIDYSILQKYITSNQISGTMPLPYSKTYEGLATALYLGFIEKGIKLNIAYIRGSEERMNTIKKGVFDFAVLSKFAAKNMINEGKEIEIVMGFGPNSYLSRHVLLFGSGVDLEMKTGLKVGIDYDSLDHVYLTKEVMKDYNVSFVNYPGNQLIQSIRDGKLDLAIWNYDEISEKNNEDIQYMELPSQFQYIEASEAVIVCKKNNSLISSLLKRTLNENKVNEIQQKVKRNEILPRY